MPLDKFIHTILFVLLWDLIWTSSYKPAITCIGLFYSYNNVCLNFIYSCMSYTSGNLKARDACRRTRVCLWYTRVLRPSYRPAGPQSPACPKHAVINRCARVSLNLHTTTIITTLTLYHTATPYRQGGEGDGVGQAAATTSASDVYILSLTWWLMLLATAAAVEWMNEWISVLVLLSTMYVCIYLCMYGFHDNDISLYVYVVFVVLDILIKDVSKGDIN